MGYFNLDEQFVFYGAYHNNHINKLIHIICVPLISWSIMVWLASVGEIYPLNFVHHLPNYHGWRPEANPSFFLGLIYLMYYFFIEPFATITYIPIVYLEFVTSGWFAANIKNAHLYAGYVQLISWVMQIGAHYVFEKRAPAFLDSLHQAIVMAPLFVWIEVLFLCGYRPELEKRLQVQVDKEIMAYQEKLNRGKGKKTE